MDYIQKWHLKLYCAKFIYCSILFTVPIYFFPFSWYIVVLLLLTKVIYALRFKSIVRF